MSTPDGGVAPPASNSAPADEGTPRRSAWWVRMLSAVPLPLLYAFSSLVGWLAWKVVPYRKELVHTHLKLAFPEMDEKALQDVMRRYYAGFADMFVEIVKSASMPPEEIRRRVRIVNMDGKLDSTHIPLAEIFFSSTASTWPKFQEAIDMFLKSLPYFLRSSSPIGMHTAVPVPIFPSLSV